MKLAQNVLDLYRANPEQHQELLANLMANEARRHTRVFVDDLDRRAGCVYCGKIDLLDNLMYALTVGYLLYDPDHARGVDNPGCRHCHIDCLIIERRGWPITPAFLAILHSYWFSGVQYPLPIDTVKDIAREMYG